MITEYSWFFLALALALGMQLWLAAAQSRRFMARLVATGGPSTEHPLLAALAG